MHFRPQMRRERVDHRDAHAVQTARYLVPLAAEFASRMEHGHDRFESGYFCLGMDFYGNAAAVVGDAHAVVRQECYLDVVGEITHRLVARVVEDFPDEVVKA